MRSSLILVATAASLAAAFPWQWEQQIYQGAYELAHELDDAVRGSHGGTRPKHDSTTCAQRHGQYKSAPEPDDGYVPFPLRQASALQSDGSVVDYSEWTGRASMDEDAPLADGPTADAVFAGFGSFAHLPMMNCLHSDASFDIGFLGMPLDTATSYRPGARFGPSGIRQGSRRLRLYGGHNVPLDVNPFSSWAKIVDCGDVLATSYDTALAIKQLEAGHKKAMARDATKEIKGKKTHPRIISLGGDHSITLPVLRSIAKVYGPVSVIHFDSHLDTWKPRVFGGAKSSTAGVNHGTYFYHAAQEGLIRNGTSVHAGIRTTLNNLDDYKNDRECGFHLHEAWEIDKIGVDGFIRTIREIVGDSPVYLSIDIDVLDPSHAPATGTPETGGWTTRELRTIVRGLEGLNFVGADVVEVAPPYDTAAEITQLAAADLMFEVLSMMVKKGPVTLST
ncbi:agmatinase [Malassezia yamatoensis]|uniref:Agmatinase n=1 Tax=Malassezia yamatoensis TaxID=253288 RepID=A0AAJ6CKP4_9BASI|nr:agmatinase [Malassezia yamatoensis]